MTVKILTDRALDLVELMDEFVKQHKDMACNSNTGANMSYWHEGKASSYSLAAQWIRRDFLGEKG